jgi:hypothetical protein
MAEDFFVHEAVREDEDPEPSFQGKVYEMVKARMKRRLTTQKPCLVHAGVDEEVEGSFIDLKRHMRIVPTAELERIPSKAVGTIPVAG